VDKGVTDVLTCYMYSSTAVGTGRDDTVHDFGALYGFTLPENMHALDLQPLSGEEQPTPTEYKSLGDLLAVFSGQPNSSHGVDGSQSATRSFHHFDNAFCKTIPIGDGK